ncbi:MAG: 5-bromo-4-chloroindolyl phosphate hydrolysis family protein [Spirochaetes bacterium]|nr:5-bromo-4-chloroindolyl phosphate hydrolysis family protein [Spirochaetota bacterium]
MKRILQLVASVVLGSAVFLFFHSLVEAGLLVSTIFGIATLLGGALLFSPKKLDPEFKRLTEVYGITPETVEKVVKKGMKKVRVMRKYAAEIEKEPVRACVERIATHTESIFLDFKTDPKDLKAARLFLNNYLDSTTNIIGQYIELSHQGKGTANEETIRKAEEVLTTIEKAFEKQLAKLYDDDFLDLDAEISVIKKSMKMEGVG